MVFYGLGNRRHALWAVPVLGIVVIAVFSMNVVAPYKVCCQTTDFDSYRLEFANIAAAEVLPRPTVSNPDLGVMSWHKQFNVVDLGRLGSPIMAQTSGPLRADYFFEYAAPDIIESHGSWSCRYDGEIFSDPRFAQRYQPLDVRVTNWAKEQCKSNPDSQSGIWVRKDILRSSASAERQLIDRLAANLSVRLLRAELERCQAPGDHNCAYVARTAWRFLPEFREQGQVDELDEIFAISRTAAFDRYLINGHRDGQVYQDFIRLLVDDYIERLIGDSRPIIHSNYDVYLAENSLLYVKEWCGRDDVDLPFFLHLIPVDLNDLPEHRKQYGFDNLDFTFRGYRLFEGAVCVARRELPEYALAAIRTGQYIRGEGRVWEGEFRLEQ